jgi:hypothetical protein
MENKKKSRFIISGTKKVLDISGLKHGSITIIKKDDNSSLWIAECICKRQIKRTYTALKKGNHTSCGADGCRPPKKSKLKDISGRKFGKLTIIGKDHKSSLWIAKCDCGSEPIKRPYYVLKKGKLKSCGSYDCRFLRYDSKAVCINSYFHFLKKGAKNRNYKFEIDKNVIADLIFNNCYYCDEPPTQMSYGKSRNVKNNGIDRVDNAIGYFVGNLRTCCPFCNVLKNDLSEDEFFEKIKKITDRIKDLPM